MDKERITKLSECIMFISNNPKVTLANNDMSDQEIAQGVSLILLINILLELGCDYRKIIRVANENYIQFNKDVPAESKGFMQGAIGLLVNGSDLLNENVLRDVADKVLFNYDKLVQKQA